MKMKRFKYTIGLISALLLSSTAFATKLTTDVERKVTSSNIIKPVNVEEFLELFDEYEELVIVDSRTKKDRSGGFVEGSLSLPDTETTPAELAKIIPSKGTPVLFYCNGVKCGRSAIAALIAEEAGYTKIFWFKGGWEAWVNNGMPVAN
ncbi:rhodanese-like domain-containing protein [Pseudoalteromonas sp. PS5]|uniref:rhodanese-like domain-containing protein n=1 Tax=Pseudoalteromonas sp. PS5 TaxID=1437473 RepID=UPI000FFE990D|nr:rhodanese-like domain-containing protein [Pseudoalteromonas sp. PS5]RXE95313.1 rhodanese-like domain-containing protein [Pseudoalteromonas sp. PS5]